MKAIRITAYLLAAVLLLTILGLGFVIYTSCFRWAPWFEPCGMQVLTILTHVAPALCFLGIVFLFGGMFMPVSTQTRFIGLLGAGLLTLPVGLSEWLHDLHIRIPFALVLKLGVITSIALVLWTVWLAVRDVKRIKSQAHSDVTALRRLQIKETKRAIAFHAVILLTGVALVAFTRFGIQVRIYPWLRTVIVLVLLAFLTDVIRFFHIRSKVAHNNEGSSPNNGADPIR